MTESSSRAVPIAVAAGLVGAAGIGAVAVGKLNADRRVDDVGEVGGERPSAPAERPEARTDAPAKPAELSDEHHRAVVIALIQLAAEHVSKQPAQRRFEPTLLPLVSGPPGVLRGLVDRVAEVLSQAVPSVPADTAQRIMPATPDGRFEKLVDVERSLWKAKQTGRGTEWEMGDVTVEPSSQAVERPTVERRSISVLMGWPVKRAANPDGVVLQLDFTVDVDANGRMLGVG